VTLPWAVLSVNLLHGTHRAIAGRKKEAALVSIKAASEGYRAKRHDRMVLT
jgi:hypothetical protein